MNAEPYGITISWYDVPAFDGGGTCVLIKDGDRVLSHLLFHSTSEAAEHVARMARAHAPKFQNARDPGGSR